MGVSDGVERQGYRHGPVRTVTMYELAGGMNAIRGGNGVSVFLPDWAMNADNFISSMVDVA